MLLHSLANRMKVRCWWSQRQQRTLSLWSPASSSSSSSSSSRRQGVVHARGSHPPLGAQALPPSWSSCCKSATAASPNPIPHHHRSSSHRHTSSSSSSGTTTTTTRSSSSSSSSDKVVVQAEDAVLLRQNLDSWVGHLELSDSGLWEVCRAVKARGGKAWLVGGCMRDALLGGSPKDIDLATDLKSSEIVEIFGKRAKATGEEFGTVTVTAGLHKSKFEITTLRRDGRYTDGRRPDEVEYTTEILEDLGRRDFTINAMAFDPLSSDLVDPFDGMRDLRTGTLRVVLSPSSSSETGRRMTEDGLRVWRAYRFMDDGMRSTREPCEELDLCLKHPDTVKAAARVSSERIWEEVQKILGGQNAPFVLRKLQENGMLRHVFDYEGDEGIESREDPRLVAQDYLLKCRRRMHEMFARPVPLPTAEGEGPAAPAAPAASRRAKTYIALDLEATCSEENNKFPQEVIQFSATLFHIAGAGGEEMRVLDHFNSLCQPVIHKELTAFCTKLTGIAQRDVNESPKFKKVLGLFQKWLQKHDLLDERSNLRQEGVTLLTCGCWDLEKLVPIQCKANSYNIPMPAYLRYYSDVQDVFANYYWSGNQNYNSLRTMSSKLGVAREGRPHNALNDSKNLAKIVHAMHLDGCQDFPVQYFDRKAVQPRENIRKHMPDISVARAALMLHKSEMDKTQKWMLRNGWKRNEDKKIIKSCLTGFKAFPSVSSSVIEMAAYKRFVGPRLRFQLCLQASLACAEHGWLSKEHLQVEEIGEQIMSMRDVEPLADGEWIMQMTGLDKGMRLGRLKEWLWKLQIENSATTLEEMEEILGGIDWQNSEVETWPRFLQLK